MSLCFAELGKGRWGGTIRMGRREGCGGDEDRGRGLV